MAKTCLVIVNPISGRGAGRRAVPKLEAALRQRGFHVELVFTAARGDAQAAAAAAPGELAAIVCVGGDGTINEIVGGLAQKEAGGGLAQKHIPLALFPIGTANVLAKEYGIRSSVRAVCDVLERGKVQAIDVALMNGRPFVLFASAGFDAAGAHSLHESRTGTIRMVSYVAPILKQLAFYRFPEIQVTVDGQSVGAASSVLVTNVRSYGGPFEFVRGANPADGLLDICMMAAHSPWAAARHALCAIARRIYKCKDVHYMRGKEIELWSAAAVPVQLDGDPAGALPVRIKLLSTQLHLLVP